MQQLPSMIVDWSYFRDIIPPVTAHPDYGYGVIPLRTVRDCIEGSQTIKRLTYHYLPHPSMGDTTSETQTARYLQYIAGAEFDGFPDLTRRGLLGKMRINQSTVEVPEKLSYLIENADGDGTSLVSSMESFVSNILQAKWHIGVAEYNGLSEIPLTDLSAEQAEQMNLRATIKHYKREDLVQWAFKRINGANQLSFVMLRERGSVFDEDSLTHKDVDAYLILALDDDGNYYQQKQVGKDKGERFYVRVNNQPLKWLPVEIIADEEMPVACLPKSMGMLYPICELSLYRYRVSADYKEAMRYLVPTIMTKGWQQGDLEVFKEINGREQILFGPGVANNLPAAVDWDVLSTGTALDPFEKYFAHNQEKIRQSGGVVKQDMAARTATEAGIDAAEQNAMLETIASNIESGYRRLISYCAMFEGLWSPDEVENRLEDIVIGLPRDFATPKLSVEEVRVMLDMIDRGVRTRDQVVMALAAGGWDIQDAEQTLDELEVEAPAISRIAVPPEPPENEDVDTGQTSD